VLKIFIILTILLVPAMFAAGCGNSSTADVTSTTTQSSIVISNPKTTWVAGEAASTKLVATGGQEPYTWSVKETSYLPHGFTLDPDGTLSGTPTFIPSSLTSMKTAPFTIVVTDANGDRQEASLVLTLILQLE
jgi:hypothetical protein